MKPAIRQKTNIIIDIAMFAVMILLAIIGIIIRYSLIQGSERWIKYGQNVELTIWGMDRHEWGLIHLIVGIFLIGLLVLHLVFHWRQIVCMIKKLIPKITIRTALVTATLVFCVLILFSPILITPKIGDPIYGKGQRLSKNNSLHSGNVLQPSVNDVAVEMNIAVKEKQMISNKEVNSVKQEVENSLPEQKVNEVHSKEEHTLNIRGFHTFSQLADKYNISTKELKRLLGIPESISNNERLGRVRRTYDFTMSDVEAAILKLQGK